MPLNATVRLLVKFLILSISWYLNVIVITLATYINFETSFSLFALSVMRYDARFHNKIKTDLHLIST
jgi:hypothetical protein